MGCTSSSNASNSNSSSSSVANVKKASGVVKGDGEISLQSVLLIQKWYRRYKARLEARRRTTWMIYQSIEYSSEASQLHLYNFFSDMLASLNDIDDEGGDRRRFAERLRQSSVEEKSEELLRLTDDSDVDVEEDYAGPRLVHPVTGSQVQRLIEAYRQGQVLHAKYLLQILNSSRSLLKSRSNIVQVSTSISKQVTVVGDLHGKLEDLLVIFYKNGLPDVTNPYVFNGDFVDRGANSVETATLLLASLLAWPTAVFINRGNHEDNVMNLRYGFVKEVQQKYKCHASRILKLFNEVFAWLPLGAVVDRRILIVHGGVSDKLDMERVKKLDRHRYGSVLRPPQSGKDLLNYTEWRQLLDLLWSDPKPQKGCRPNTFRGGGSYFGPDVTENFLRKFRYTLLVRSHECKPDGWEFGHNGSVLTIFSASNYYEDGSNRGAYVKFDSNGRPHIVQYMASRASRLPAAQRLSAVEEGALKGLREKILASRTQLMTRFAQLDPGQTGLLRLNDWCDCMESILQLQLPWRTLRQHLVSVDHDGFVQYETTFKEASVQLPGGEMAPAVTEAVYKNKEDLETIFRIMDKDNSGHISLEEFKDSCRILCEATKREMSNEEVEAMAKSMDLNSDGFIDFNEFLEAFRIVDCVQNQQQQQQQKQQE